MVWVAFSCEVVVALKTACSLKIAGYFLHRIRSDFAKYPDRVV